MEPLTRKERRIFMHHAVPAFHSRYPIESFSSSSTIEASSPPPGSHPQKQSVALPETTRVGTENLRFFVQLIWPGLSPSARTVQWVSHLMYTPTLLVLRFPRIVDAYSQCVIKDQVNFSSGFRAAYSGFVTACHKHGRRQTVGTKLLYIVHWMSRSQELDTRMTGVDPQNPDRCIVQ